MSRAFLSGTVADICFDLVATRSEYGDERELADLVERRVVELGLDHERIGNAIVARAGGPGVPIALVGHLDCLRHVDFVITSDTDHSFV
jgi:acetylornithine deacetylase/succinyl-diaminopimelate desuccinylase-like protein